MIEAVVFDLDDVLCRYRIERRLALLAAWSGRSPDAIHAAIWRSGFEDEAEHGAFTAEAYLDEFGRRMGYPLSAPEWVTARRAATEPDEAVLAIARDVGADRPVAMFTNNPFLLKRHIGEVLPAVPAIFGERAVFSAELGCRKPDPEAFRRLAERLGVPPGRVLFFDDNPEYVAGARAAGVVAYRFEGAAAVLDRLAAHGIRT
jgi:putative hydrolase of the HAD superfamily